MIVRLGDGRCRINIKDGQVNTYLFMDTEEKDDFLLMLYESFKIKHKKIVPEDICLMATDGNDNLNLKKYDVFVWTPGFSDFNEDKEFQKLMLKHILTLDSEQVDISNTLLEVRDKLCILIQQISRELNFTNIRIENDLLTLGDILKGIDLKCINKENENHSVLDVKIKYINLLNAVNVTRKEKVYIVLYPETGICGIDQIKLREKIKELNGTIIILTNSPLFLSNTENLENSYLICKGYKSNSMRSLLKKVKVIDSKKAIEEVIYDIFIAISSGNSELKGILYSTILE